MISNVTGEIRGLNGHIVTIDLGSIGLDIQAPHSAVLAAGQKISLFVYMH